MLKFASGKYKFKKNKIELIKYFKNSSINHELFHMATSFYDKNKKLEFCGFAQINLSKKEYIGCGLNEGYTELLSNRYFNEQIKFKAYSYQVCTFFASKLEEIVGKEKMEKLYMTADLYELYKYLNNFDDSCNIVTFIVVLDWMIKKVSYTNSKKYEKFYQLIECYLAKWYILKKKKELEHKIINKETFEQDINNYINSLGNKELKLENYIKQKEYCLK